MKIHVNPYNCTIDKLLFRDSQIPLVNFGFEIGDFCSFFGQSLYGRNDNGRLLCKRIETNLVESDWAIGLVHGRFKISVREEVKGETLHRRLKIRVLEDSFLGDLVLRGAFSYAEGSCGRINGLEIRHEDSNVYHDSEADGCAMLFNNGIRLRFQWENHTFNRAFTRYFYIRDEIVRRRRVFHPPELARNWIIHARLLVDFPDEFVYRLWRNPLVVHSLSRWIPASFFRKRLLHWRSTEWKMRKYGSLYGIAFLKKDVELAMHITVKVEMQ